jgi:hypothetical protein
VNFPLAVRVGVAQVATAMRAIFLSLLGGSVALAAGDPPAMSATDDGKSLTLKMGGAEVLSFRHAPMPPPAGASALYTRSGFIHPLRTPSGQTLTVIHPSDHIHHLGLWNPWTATQFDGRKTDYWNLATGQGTVRFVEFAGRTSEPDAAGFTARLDYVDLKAPGGELVTLHENQSVRLVRVPDDLPPGFLIHFTSEQWCATDKPFEVSKYRYSGIGFRARTDWNKTNSDYLTDAGKTRADGNTTRARWARIQGTVDGKTCGLLMMSHPANFNHPEPIRIWPATDHNGMVFFNFNPAQDRAWTLEPGQRYLRRYAIFTYDGELTPDQAEALWRHSVGAAAKR